MTPATMMSGQPVPVRVPNTPSAVAPLTAGSPATYTTQGAYAAKFHDGEPATTVAGGFPIALLSRSHDRRRLGVVTRHPGSSPKNRLNTKRSGTNRRLDLVRIGPGRAFRASGPISLAGAVSARVTREPGMRLAALGTAAARTDPGVADDRESDPETRCGIRLAAADGPAGPWLLDPDGWARTA